jgi:hypothetical protein
LAARRLALAAFAALDDADGFCSPSPAEASVASPNKIAALTKNFAVKRMVFSRIAARFGQNSGPRCGRVGLNHFWGRPRRFDGAGSRCCLTVFVERMT